MLVYTLATAAVAVASSTTHKQHQQQYQHQHEPLGYGYRTRHSPGELTPHADNNDNTNDNIIVHASSYLQPNTFEDHLFRSGSGGSGSSSSASHHHSTKHHSNNNNNASNNHSPKSKSQQQLPNDIDMKSLLNIDHHRIFQLHDDSSSSLRQTIRQQDSQRPPANDNCSMASIITTLPYATQSTTIGSTSDFTNTASCGAEANTQGVWYSFTPSVSGLYKTYVSSGLNLGIRIYSGTCNTSSGDVSNLACVSQFNSLHTFIGVANTEYKLLISEQDSNSSSEGTSFVNHGTSILFYSSSNLPKIRIMATNHTIMMLIKTIDIQLLLLFLRR